MSSSNEKPIIRDRGLECWLQALKAHLLIFVSWGIVNSFGIFQTYYKSTFLKDNSLSSIAWIGTVEGFSIILVSLLIGPIYDRGYIRPLIIIGSILIIFGMIMTSLSKKYYQFFIYQALCIGIGSGCVFIPSLGIITRYFDKKQSLAAGIITSGASVGGLVFPVLFELLIDRIGFAWTIRAFSLVSFILIIISIIITEVYAFSSRSPCLFNFSSLKDRTFMIFNVSVFFIFTGIYFPYFYLPMYANALGSRFSTYFISVINLTSIFGRVITGVIADYKGPLNTFILSTLALVILTYAWIGIRNIPGLFIFSILYGIFAGAVMSLPSAIIIKLSSNLNFVGTQMSICLLFTGIGFLIGTPIDGIILKRFNKAFFWAQIFSATIMLIGIFALFPIIYSKRNRLLISKTSSSGTSFYRPL
ncbi:hypothetical protein T552_02245 [Pneumocystis carinii B80]|uniref:Major facilitator superfamily (MFS) profile domain-containing protein n=1 Tax=Pneumocystis carinii (strain B80) TaxID=1408658 RepID=A0A0W4ZHF7_PNEC8|nr:hypothetical protein T552_02245 [Pneumocystis carinii B80]KTW27806.1 hypothetical protein T552_02245 [Pneumocystis carinii B80]